jgi:hypothetical protein
VTPFVYRERMTMTELIDRYFGPAPTKISEGH